MGDIIYQRSGQHTLARQKEIVLKTTAIKRNDIISLVLVWSLPFRYHFWTCWSQAQAIPAESIQNKYRVSEAFLFQPENEQRNLYSISKSSSSPCQENIQLGGA
jgi:hypothetical protein